MTRVTRRINDDGEVGLPQECAACPESARVHGFCRGHYAKLEFDLQYRLKMAHEDGNHMEYMAAIIAAKESLES
jgi:hypothetical protein